jgi:hypothetical protein
LGAGKTRDVVVRSALRVGRADEVGGGLTGDVGLTSSDCRDEGMMEKKAVVGQYLKMEGDYFLDVD